ncbi:MAG: uroporphyrinogen-III synthase [Flavobacteriales bacterium]|nr:uroporphyrinogen-III synthase [Flavobacteriales bacterium]
MSKQTLNNIKVLIPRPVGHTDEFSEKLIKLGAQPVLFPLIEVLPINQKELLDIYQNQKFDWILFTSKVAVQFFFETLNPKDITSKIAVVGTSTQKEVEKLGLKVNFTPSAATAKKLVKEIPLNKGEKVLIPRSKIAGNDVVDTLKKRGMNVTEISIYNNTPVEYSYEEMMAVLKENINVITFTSGSTVESFVKLLRKYKIKLDTQHIVSIGSSTTSMIKKMHLNVDKTAEQHNVDGLIESIESLYK